MSAFPRRKALHLFKLIILQPDYQLHRDQVIELLWSHLEPDSAKAQLYKHIHYVRQALESVETSYSPDTLFALHHEVISLTVPNGIYTDVAQFEHLAYKARQQDDISLLKQVIACYQGDLLPTDLYEEWTTVRRNSLREQFVDALVKLGQKYQDARHFAEAVDVLRQALARDNLRETAHQGLMHIYALQGSRTRALRQYQQCQKVLDSELDVEPSAKTKRLYHDILNDKIEKIPVAHPLLLQELPRLPPLIGRQSEQQIIQQLLEDLGQGKGATVTLEGQAGIGKTRLAQEIIQMVGQRWLVLWGSSHQQEGRSPYTPFIEALRKAIRINSQDAHLLPAELALAIPELPAEVQPVETADRVAAQGALFASTQRFLAARARQVPIVLILDDLHYADSGTLKLFHYLARQTKLMRLLLVGIWRTDEPTPTARFEQVLENLNQKKLLHRLVLHPLSETAHHRLLEQSLEGGNIDPLLSEKLYVFSIGNPLFATEMLRQLIENEKIELVENEWRLADKSQQDFRQDGVLVSTSLQVLVSNRLESLSPAALRMLQFASVAGQDIPVQLLEEYARLGEHHVIEPAFLDVLDDAVQVGLLREQGFSYRFSHPFYRQVIYHKMSKMRQRALHKQVATSLERAFQDEPAALPVESVAYHYLQTGNVDRAVTYLIQAGDRAESIYDHESAIHRYQEALSVLEERQIREYQQRYAELYERIGDVYRAIGNVSEGLKAYRQVFNILTSGTTQPENAMQRTLHRKITHTAVLTPDMPTAAEHLEQAWGIEIDDELEQARLLITQALYDWHANQLEDAIKHASQALSIAEHHEAPVETSQACEMLAMSHLPLGHWEEGLQYELRRQTPDWSPEIVVAVDAHLCLYQFRFQGSESYEEVKAAIERVTQQSSTLGNLRCLAICHYVLGSLSVLQAKPHIATEHLKESLALHQYIGSQSSAAYTLARQADLLTIGGNPQAGWECVQKGLEIAHEAAIRDHALMLLHSAGILNRLSVDDLESSAELVALAELHDAQTAPCVVCSVDRYAALATYYVAINDLDEATQYATQALQLAESGHNQLGQARVLQVQGQIHLAQNDLFEAEVCLNEATTIFRDLNNLYDLAQTLQVYSDFATGIRVSSVDIQSKVQAARELLMKFQMNGDQQHDN